MRLLRRTQLPSDEPAPAFSQPWLLPMDGAASLPLSAWLLLSPPSSDAPSPCPSSCRLLGGGLSSFTGTMARGGDTANRGEREDFLPPSCWSFLRFLGGGLWLGWASRSRPPPSPLALSLSFFVSVCFRFLCFFSFSLLSSDDGDEGSPSAAVSRLMGSFASRLSSSCSSSSDDDSSLSLSSLSRPTSSAPPPSSLLLLLLSPGCPQRSGMAGCAPLGSTMAASTCRQTCADAGQSIQ
mmetsp:Transcript_19922/g.57130  ORF Transcript_19922/g.57130 Transcript_19922/m.57130 type:complete len:238 (-) Transcript_19922:569-1282(-)